ncbi:beta-ketoacyl-ACP synthase III [Desulfatibacillum aliphaticivorans]|uniref:beta-ketoacyl-ACP synthase III n=1 Tax=Desulfatibacillum aliphaticivorans TaxID=218208 RepID=UPI000404FAAB|nr:beta-ketoacyl-ACP synthase III [Desulfatibacillum aliphaticivorans]
MIRSVISGIGSYVPPTVVTNDDLAQFMDTSDEWIQTRSGIKERRYAEDGVFCSDLAVEACKRAVDDAGIEMQDVDYLIFATLSPDYHFPGTGCYLQAKLGLEGQGVLDVRNQCTGFLYSLSIADAFVRTGQYKNVLVVGSEVHSSALDFSTRGRDVTVLFGDGAGAAVVSPCEDPNRGLLYSELHADGKHARALYLDIWDMSRKPYMTHDSIDNTDIFPKMDGRTVFKHAVTRLVETVENTFKTQNVNPDDIKFFIPHQANMRINQIVADKLGIDQEKFLHNMQNYGNTTAASIPLLLDETYRAGKLERGDLIMMLGFGAGFTWGANLMRW